MNPKLWPIIFILYYVAFLVWMVVSKNVIVAWATWGFMRWKYRHENKRMKRWLLLRTLVLAETGELERAKAGVRRGQGK